MKILHLYPNLMNLYGDYGNISILVKHLKDQGLSVRVETKELNELINFEKYDFIYMGSGTESNQMAALNDLMKYQYQINKYIESDKIMLLTGNAMEVLGKRIGDTAALDILDFTTEISDKRYTGDVILHNDEIGDVVGFINRSSIVSGAEEHKLFDYIFKDNNLIDNYYEGYRYHNVFGSHVIGPMLVKNPNFLEYIVKLIMKDNFKKFDYPYEEAAYIKTLTELRKR